MITQSGRGCWPRPPRCPGCSGPRRGAAWSAQGVEASHGVVVDVEDVEERRPLGDRRRRQVLQIVIGELLGPCDEVGAAVVAAVRHPVAGHDGAEHLRRGPRLLDRLRGVDVAVHHVVPRDGALAAIVGVHFGMRANPVVRLVVEVEEHGGTARPVVDLEEVHELVLGDGIGADAAPGAGLRARGAAAIRAALRHHVRHERRTARRRRGAVVRVRELERLTEVRVALKLVDHVGPGRAAPCRARGVGSRAHVAGVRGAIPPGVAAVAGGHEVEVRRWPGRPRPWPERWAGCRPSGPCTCPPGFRSWPGPRSSSSHRRRSNSRSSSCRRCWRRRLADDSPLGGHGDKGAGIDPVDVRGDGDGGGGRVDLASRPLAKVDREHEATCRATVGRRTRARAGQRTAPPVATGRASTARATARATTRAATRAAARATTRAAARAAGPAVRGAPVRALSRAGARCTNYCPSLKSFVLF